MTTYRLPSGAYMWTHTAVDMPEHCFVGCHVCGRIEALGKQKPSGWTCTPETTEQILRHALQQR